MRLEELLNLVKSLGVGAESSIYEVSDGTRFFLRRPNEVSKGLKKDYDLETNIQIWAEEFGKPAFMPNHLRLMIDLEFFKRALPGAITDLLTAFDRVFYGEDPLEVYNELRGIELPPVLRPLDYSLCLEQLFISEQAIGYKHPSKFDPKYLYLHGYVRAVLCGNVEIDRLIWSATRNPPSPKYTSQDDKNHKKFKVNRDTLWYLEKNTTLWDNFE